jgi:salicylate hydroxylase
VHLHFQDGTASYADAVVGTDGIQGYARQYVLGKEYPAIYAGSWDCRALVPIEEVRKFLGDDYIEVNRQYVWMGQGGVMMLNVLDGGRTAYCTATCMSDDAWNNGDSSRSFDRTWLEKSFQTLGESGIKEGMISVSPHASNMTSTADMDTVVTTTTPGS